MNQLAYTHSAPLLGGNPPILFIHGMDSGKETWAPVIGSIKERYEIYAIDLRGHGETPLGKYKEYTLDLLAEDVHQFVLDKKLDQFLLVGHSMGSRVCVAYVNKYPGTVKALAIEDMDLMPRDKMVLSEEELAKLKEFKQTHATESEARKELALYKNKFDSWKAQGRIKVQSDNLWHIAFNPFTSYLAHNACQANDKAAKMFKKLNNGLPVLLMVAEKGSSTTEEGIEEMREMSPGMKVVTIPGSEHAIHKTNTKGFVAELSTFFKAYAK